MYKISYGEYWDSFQYGVLHNHYKITKIKKTFQGFHYNA